MAGGTKIKSELGKHQRSPASIEQTHNQIFRSSSPAIGEKVAAEQIVSRVNRLHEYFSEMKKNIDLIRGAGIDASDELVEKVASRQISEIKKVVRQVEPEIRALADIRKPDFKKYRAFGSDEEFDPRAASKELQALLQEVLEL